MFANNNLGYNYAEVLNERCLFSVFNSLINKSYTIDTKFEQRGIGDYIEGLVVEEALINYPAYFVKRSSKKSTEDFALDVGDITHFVDIKTHDIHSTFSMPNLTAVDKLAALYSDAKKSIQLHYLFVSYTLLNGVLTIKDVKVCRPHNLSWKYLNVANLGNGQLQIKNMHKVKIDYTINKQKWFRDFINKVVDFKYKTIDKMLNSIDMWSTLDVK